ncbi:hypothetical protein [Thioclava sp. GXIMD2076]|uniref:HAD family hydrolase n=1 Tax=Thioclava sp. GXIMD2076 TaxID=3131931 RepID=UPI0030CDDCE5
MIYSTLVFDCDGVILNSNVVKTDAFRSAALPYGEAAAEALVEYHISRGGISRYEKFRYFLEVIVPQYSSCVDGPGLDQLLEDYASFVRSGLMECEVAPALDTLRQRLPNTPWMVASGGAQGELREVFAERRLSEYFDAGIFGSPDAKVDILQREIASGNIRLPAVLLGDSKYDFQAACECGLDFIFVSNWSEVSDWREWSQKEGFKVVSSLNSLMHDRDFVESFSA